MMRKASLLIVLVVLGLLISSLFVVQQGTQGLLFRFGKVVTESKTQQAEVYSAGLHLKLPFVDTVQLVPTSIQTLTTTNQNVQTADKQNIVLDAYLKWQITNPYLFYLASDGGDSSVIQNSLTQALNQLLAHAAATHSIQQLMGSSSVSQQLQTVLNQGNTTKNGVKEINFQPLLSQVSPELLQGLNSESVAVLGIKVIGVGISKILPPADQLNDIFNKMSGTISSEVQQVQTQAQEAAEKNQAQAEQQANKVIGKAQQQAAKIRGAAEAASVKLYASAFKNESDFYGFVKSLEVYERSFEKGNNMVILTPDGQLFRYLDTLKK